MFKKTISWIRGLDEFIWIWAEYDPSAEITKIHKVFSNLYHVLSEFLLKFTKTQRVFLLVESNEQKTIQLHGQLRFSFKFIRILAE